MPWLRMDDGFTTHPKVMGLSLEAKVLWMYSLGHCAHELTDGFVQSRVVPALAGLAGLADPSAASDELVASGLWEASPLGYQVHDYLEYNPSRAEVLAEREKAKVRMQRTRCSGEVRKNLPDPGPGPGPVPGSPDPEIHGARKRAGADAPTEAPEPGRSRELPNGDQVKALLDGFGHDLSSLTSGERSKLFTAGKQLAGAHRAREDILTAIANWPKVYPRATITYLGVAGNITRLLEEGGPRANGHCKPATEPFTQRYLGADGTIRDASGTVLGREGAHARGP